MDEKNFNTFIEIMRVLKRRNLDKSSIEETMMELMNRYRNELTEEQKAELLKRISDSEKKKKEKKNDDLSTPQRDYF